MLHSLPHLMSFRRQDLDVYRKVNRRFADNLVPLLRPDDRIWVHDYHLMSLPGALRQRGVLGPHRLLPACPLPGAGSGWRRPASRGLVQDAAGLRPAGLPDRDGPRQFRRDRGAASPARCGPTAISVDSAAGRCGSASSRPSIAAPEFAATAARADGDRAAIAGWHGRCGARRCCSASTGWTPTKGLPERLEAFRRLVARRPAPQPDHAADRRPLAGGRAGAIAGCGRRSTPRPAASTANSASPTGPRCACWPGRSRATTLAGFYAAGPRRHRHADPRRHEPGGQGIHRRAGPGRSGRAGAVALRRRGGAARFPRCW